MADSASTYNPRSGVRESDGCKRLAGWGVDVGLNSFIIATWSVFVRSLFQYAHAVSGLDKSSTKVKLGPE